MAVEKKSKRGPAAKAAVSPAAKAAASIDEQLAKYRSMRKFAATAEPAGSANALPSGGKRRKSADPLPFVVQKHAATRLHYDFRLGWRGVLKSWAVAKGPSYVVADKRLAVQVEDHPIEYGGFEGTIPKGQYGGGTVMLWDDGTWEPVGDVDEGLRSGRLKFILHGQKLKGHWTLVRMGGKAAQEAKPNWLLMKEHDAFERPAEAESVTDEKPKSVVTGRELNQIAADEDYIWDSRSGLAADARKAANLHKPAKRSHEQSAPTQRQEPETAAKAEKAQSAATGLSSYPEEKMPAFVPPQLASAAANAPTGEAWIHELKLDGYRIQAHLDAGQVKLFSRNGLDWTRRMASVAQAVKHLSAGSAVLDGEVVVLDENGLSDFSRLQASFEDSGFSSRKRANTRFNAKAPAGLTYYCFDLLHLDGHDLRDAQLTQRKEILRALLIKGDGDVLRYSEHLATDGEEMFGEACRLGAEGIISKRANAKYQSGRSASWTKTKCIRQQEFVIGGFTLPGDGPGSSKDGLGALLLGYYAGDKLKYAGRAGTGFTRKSARSIRNKLEELEMKSSRFADVPAAAAKGARWVQPELVAQIHFRTWTTDGLLRQASFKGLREDKQAREVVRELAVPADAHASAEENPGRQPANAETKPVATKSAPRAGATMRLTHASKVIDAGSGLTKQMLADYYTVVAEKMLPHIAGRPLSIVRCPEGSTGKCFFQKHMKVGLPKGTGTVEVPDKKTGKIEEYITVSSKEALVGMAQMNVLELHPWGATNDCLEEPDRLVFDLDPDEELPWEVLAGSAAEVRSRLQKLGLKSFLKGTGGKGLHVIVPIQPRAAHGWPFIKAFAHAFVSRMETENAKLYLTRMSKAARTGKIYLDYLRNERGATAVAPYSPRSRAGVPVSAPFAWSVLQGKSLPRYQAATFEQWLGKGQRDPWQALPATIQSITQAAIDAVGLRDFRL